MVYVDFALIRREIASITDTVTRIMGMRKAVYCQLLTRMRSESWTPMPLAPRMPRMVAERTVDSKK